MENMKFMTAKRVQVRGIENYIFTHGKAPRGQGNWAFQIGQVEEWFSGTFSAAVKQAKSVAAAVDEPIVTVLT
jgi:hypothetical protein